MDPLSDVLSLLKPRSFMSGAFDKGGDWSIGFGRHEGIKFQAVLSGGFWVCVEGVDEPVRVNAGDCFLLPRGLPFRLTSDPALPPVDAHTLLDLPLNGRVGKINGGGDSFSAGCHFTFAGAHADLLLGMLPPIVHIRAESDKAAMRWFVERLMLELREPQPGGFVVAQQLATMILVQALRLQLTEGSRGGVGWLFALSDKQMSTAIHAMHDDPAHRWTIQALAERAGMSRSNFALRFRQTVGTSPMEYLTRWRMMVAADRLATSGDAIAVVAPALGYESESAFGTAFKRVMGCSPRQYARAPAATTGLVASGE